MQFTCSDIGQLSAAVLAGGMVIALPGLALARLLRVSFKPDETGAWSGIVVGLSILPLIDSLLTRFAGLDCALAASLCLAIYGGWRLARERATWWIGGASALVLVWFVLLSAEWVDFDWVGRLYQPFTVIDTVKHAATAQAILVSGAPPRDAFFLRPGHASYYYFFYTLAALVMRLAGGVIEAKAAVGGVIFWTGLGLFGLVRMVISRLGIDRPAPRASVVVILLVLLASGLDIIGVLRLGLLQGIWLADPLFWNEQVPGWLESLLWVPHHVTGLIAGILGIVALADAVTPGAAPDRPWNLALASCCFASSLGLSVWLTLALVATVAGWCVMLLLEGRWRALGLIALAGGLALVLAAPQIQDLRLGRAPGPLPILPTVRAFSPVDGLVPAGSWRLLARLVALPINYLAGFGALASGAILFWRDQRHRRSSELGRVLAVAAVAGLCLGAFFKSTLFNNDLGWRVVLYPLFAGTVWTLVALEDGFARAPRRTWRAIPFSLLLLLGLGWATSLYAMVSLRAYPWIATDPDVAFMAADPQTEHALRLAYEWANRDLAANLVLQHNPTRPRAFAFGLYGRNPTGVADSFGSLYGAASTVVDARIDVLAPIFMGFLPDRDVLARARANGIDAIVVTINDPVWKDASSFVWHLKTIYASARVRIIATTAIDLPRRIESATQGDPHG